MERQKPIYKKYKVIVAHEFNGWEVGKIIRTKVTTYDRFTDYLEPVGESSKKSKKSTGTKDK